MTLRGHITGASIAALGLFCWSGDLHASPFDDLSSPSQETRDAAAKVLRGTYTPPSRTNWDGLVRALHPGTSMVNVEKELQSSNLVVCGGLSSGNTEVKTYRLDHLWTLNCSFTNDTESKINAGLSHVALREQLQNVWVEPPTNFTGVWRTYWANGQPSHEVQLKDAQPEGLLTTFYTDGSKAVVSSQRGGVSGGEEIGFYPSGHVRYRGRSKVGIHIGKWIWYKEDGSIESKKDYGSK